MTYGKYTRDFYITPSLHVHNGDGIYRSIELGWLRWYLAWYFYPGERR